MAAAAAASLPDWALLDRFIFLRDDTSFPAADPTAASSTNSLGDKGRRRCPVALSAPLRLWHLARVLGHVQGGSFRHTDQNLRRLECLDMGVLRRGEDDMAVAELQIIRTSEEPELHVLIPSSSGSSRWQSKKMRFIHAAAELDLEQFLWNWSADAVVPFGRYLCWVDYCQGAILLCDVFNDSPALRYLALPAKLPGMYRRGFGSSLADMFMTVGVNEESGVMKFVRVVGGNGRMIGLEYIPESGFAADSWILEITEKDEMIWKKGAAVRSDDLLLSEAFAKLPPMPLQFPHVSLNDPSIVYFVKANHGHVMDGIEYDNTWLVAIDMPNKTVKSSFQYIKKEESSSDEYTSSGRRRVSSLTSALVETRSQLANIPWDPMSSKWGAMSKPGSPVVVLQGGDERRGVACWEPELVVDRRSEAPQRTFGPMLVEVCLRPGSLSVGVAAPASLGVLGARESPVLQGLDKPRVDVENCGALGADNDTTSASGLGLEDDYSLWPRIWRNLGRPPQL
ncbi:unnamed protein product [Miscanthus lutarioriparius]|uniref:DUF1618 domain-containing protein n=1 Tax=Miscanthus lutarioriparius TaxID=422564 RepID=A0A811MVL2_9POAL|nr:unnamed protein product [Miscanthus lutarioriparius]